MARKDVIKQFIVQVYDNGKPEYVAVQVIPKRNGDEAVKYSSSSISDCLLRYRIIDKALEDLPVWISLRQARNLFNGLMNEEDANIWLDWLNEEVNPQIEKLAPKIKEGTQLRIVNGLLLRAHPENSDLYSLTDAWRAARTLFYNERGRLTPTAEKAWMNKKPGIWLRDNKLKIKKIIKDLNEDNLIQTNKTKICQDAEIDITRGTVIRKSRIAKIEFIKNLKLGGRNTASGTYVHPRLLASYTDWLHEDLHSKIMKVFIDYMDGVPNRDKARGTTIREEGRIIHALFTQDCALYRASPIVASSQIHIGLWNKDRRSKKKEDGIREPFRDNISVSDHIDLSMAELSARKMMALQQPYGQKEVNDICLEAGLNARHYVKLLEKATKTKKSKIVSIES